MKLVLLGGRANQELTGRVAALLGLADPTPAVADFPDGELGVRVPSGLEGADVYLLQPTSPPAEKHLLELLFLADASRRAGSARLTGVIPYFGYARQDRLDRPGEALGARLVADLLATRFDRIVAVDLHNPAIQGFFPTALEHLSSVPLLAEAARASLGDHAVVVAPDLGAAKLAEQFAQRLDLPVAYVHKVRRSGSEVHVGDVVGDVEGRSPLVVDDMISTGATLEAAVRALLARHGSPSVCVAACHAVLAPGAIERLVSLPLEKLFVTDSVNRDLGCSLPAGRVSLDRLLADAIVRMHRPSGPASGGTPPPYESAGTSTAHWP